MTPIEILLACAGASIALATLAAFTTTDAQKRQRRRDKLRRQNERAMRRELRRHYLDRFV